MSSLLTSPTCVTQVFAPQAQAVEDAAQSLVTIPSIDDSEGIQLDVIGLIVGQQRAGLTDTVYRMYLRARIAANRSSGTNPDIYNVFRLLFGVNTSMAIVNDTVGGFFELTIYDPITAQEAKVALGFLGDAKDAGVGANLIWQQVDDADLFAFAGGTGLGFNDGEFRGSSTAE